MVDFSALISRIEAAVYENGVQAITGQILQDCLKDVVNTVNVAKQDGIYRVTVTVDNNTGVPSATARMDDDTYTLEFSFHNLKGETGPQGPQGDTPVLTADSDGVIYSDGVMLTRVIKDTTDALTTRADSDHARAESDHARAETDHTDITRARGDAETAASEANYASLRANTAADNADAAREAIQSDLAAKQDVIVDLPQIREGATDTVKYTSQSLTDAQKEQARTNIGAASESEVSQLGLQVDELELVKSYTTEGGVSPNLFDKTTMLDGFISANYGSIGSNDGSKISDYIPVIPGHYYLISGRTLTGVYSMRLLDENKSSSWLKPLVASTGVAHNKFALPSEDGSTNVANGQFKVPSGAAYVQFTVKYDATNGSPDAVMLTDLGDTYSANPPTPEYQPYGTDFKIKRSALPESLETDLSEIQAETDSVKSHFEDVVSPNLFNKDDALVKSGYYATNGTWNGNVNHYSVTHPIFLKAGVTYKAVYPSGLGATNTCIAIVDKDNNYLNSHLTGTISDGFITVTPSSDCYASFNCGYDGADTLMVCKQSEYPASYTPYYKYTVLVGVSVPSTSKLVGKSVIFTGDSICQATTDNGSGGGWAKRIGDKNNMIWQNKGINGGTITDKDVVGSSFTISDTDFGTGADYIILEGGTNDADRIGSIIAGTTPTNYGSFSETGYSDTFTNDTFCGAVEYLLKRVVSSFPSARVGFIIAPKMGVSNDYTKDGNNRRAYFETIIKLCKKWGVPVLNLWDGCTMNPKLASHYTSGQDYLYVDGQHPTGNGYDLISPIIESWMETL